MTDTSSLLEDVGKGAAMGLPFGGPVGAAIGGLGGIFAHYAPSLLSDLFGQDDDKAVAMATAAVAVVEQVTGTQDPVEAMKAVAADPSIETNLRVKLAQISADLRRAELDAQKQTQDAALQAMQQRMQAGISDLQARLADVSNARSTMVSLASGNSWLSYMPAVISFLVLFGFFAVILLVLLRQLDQNSLLVGGLMSMATGVISYWVGTNASSQTNRQQLVDIANRQADSVPSDLVRQLIPSSTAAIVAPLEAAVSPFVKGGSR